MNKFKVNDVVKCEWGYFSRIDIGETYKVRAVSSTGGSILITTASGDLWYDIKYFKLVSREFDMVNNPWFIRVNNEEEFGVVADFLEAKGFRFYEKKYTKNTQAIGNTDLGGNIERDSKVVRLMTSEIEKVIHHGGEEIKINFKKTISIDSVDYPEVKSAQQVEIEQIETEMRNLADRLNKLKGD